LKGHIRKYYNDLFAGKKNSDVPVARGRALAAELGYPSTLIEDIPEGIWEDFLPCGNVLGLVHSESGGVYLNLGCGIGVDSFGLSMPLPAGQADARVVSIDTAMPALIKASSFAKKVFPTRALDFICADGGMLPFEEGVFDSVILNGVFNLFPDKREVIFELRRVLKEGGRVIGADLSRRTDLPDYFATEPDAWAWCMSGALSKQELIAAFLDLGFQKLELMSEKMDDFFDRSLFVFQKAG
jgi:ubiquinone/menaquinone biosynthesis C-methylase UbiE